MSFMDGILEKTFQQWRSIRLGDAFVASSLQVRSN